MADEFKIVPHHQGEDDVETRIAACEILHLQLRPNMERPYVQHILEILDEGGQFVAGHNENGICCLALYRIFKTTLGGPRLYVDDLVTDQSLRGRSYGEKLLMWIEGVAKSQGCGIATLESGVQRADAHRFYFRNGYAVTAFSFEKTI